MAIAGTSNAHRAIRLARLKLSAPSEVYEALEAYGANAWTGGPISRDTDEKLELALEARGDPLINLGLAKNADGTALVQRLYSRARDGSGDAQYNKAVRLACLGNMVAGNWLFASRRAGLDHGEERRLALEGEDDEIKVWMQNPRAGAVLRDVYSRNAPFDSLPEDRWMFLVEASTGNPRLTLDESNNDNPDLLAWDIQKAVFRLLLEAPTNAEWLQTLYFLLLHLNKDSVTTPGDGDLTKVLERWAGVKVPQLFSSEAEEQVGPYTDLTFAEEFRCLLASLYGRTFEQKVFVVQGALDDPDLARRCAYYGNAALNTEQIQEAFERDGKALCFAAINNDRIMLESKSRAALECLLGGDFLRMYEWRCKELAKKWQWFNPNLFSKDLGDEAETPSAAETTAKEVAELKFAVMGLKVQLSSLSTITAWGLIVIGALLVWNL